MELSSAPTHQLLDIHRAIKKELKRRRLTNKKLFKYQLRSYDHFHDVADDFPNLANAVQGLLPALRNSHYRDRMKYLSLLLKQDWSHLFESEAPCHGDYYVYAHCDPRGKLFAGLKNYGGVCPGMPFYIGKGRLCRAYDLNRNQGHGIRLREILKLGYDKEHIVHIVKRGMSECEAYELESKLIYFFGTIYEDDIKGMLLNLEIGKRPDFKCHMHISNPPKKKKGDE